MEYEQRDPIVHEFDLTCDAEHAFDAFANHMGAWWLADYTGNPETFSDVTIDPWLGGQVTERHRDGAEHDWGGVIAWEPGVRLAYTNTLGMNRAWPTIIRVGFTPSATGCHVRFEHGGWDDRNIGEQDKFDDWPLLLDRYRRYAETGSPEA